MEKTANEKPTDNGPTDELPKEQVLSYEEAFQAGYHQSQGNQPSMECPLRQRN